MIVQDLAIIVVKEDILQEIVEVNVDQDQDPLSNYLFFNYI